MVAHGSLRVKFSFITFSLEASDVFQVPTLDSLQPNLDEFMEHFETLTGKILSQVRTTNSNHFFLTTCAAFRNVNNLAYSAIFSLGIAVILLALPSGWSGKIKRLKVTQHIHLRFP